MWEQGGKATGSAVKKLQGNSLGSKEFPQAGSKAFTPELLLHSEHLHQLHTQQRA